MQIKYFRAGGGAVRDIEVPAGARLADVLQLAGEKPDQLLREGFHARVGGQRGELKQVLDRPVRPDTQVVLVPKIKGG